MFNSLELLQCWRCRLLETTASFMTARFPQQLTGDTKIFFFSTPLTPTLQCKEPQLVCTFYLVTINDSYFPDSPMNNIIALLNCSFLVSSCPCYLVVARLETSSSGVTLHCDNLPRDVSLDTLCAGRT